MGLNQIKLRVSEIFYSIQGESRFAGYPCVFIRLQGCNARCVWCDTPYAQDIDGGKIVSGVEIYEALNSYKCNFIEFTGGEPLLQENIYQLMELLLAASYQIAVETSGTVDVSRLNKEVIKIMDFKCPSSGMESKNVYTNIQHITKKDELKFVIGSREDFDFAVALIEKYHLINRVYVINFSPVAGQIEPAELAEWVLKYGKNVKLMLQMHKYIWDPNERAR